MKYSRSWKDIEVQGKSSKDRKYLHDDRNDLGERDVNGEEKSGGDGVNTKSLRKKGPEVQCTVEGTGFSWGVDSIHNLMRKVRRCK